MRIQYNKLVRDRIPEIIREEDKACGTRTLTNSEYKQALRDKLLEEASEIVAADDSELASELGDLLEVADALVQAYDIDEITVQEKRKIKHMNRGGFDRRIELLWVEE